MAKVELAFSPEKLVEFGKKALEKGDYLLCVQNYNEALSLAEVPEQKAAVYRALSDLYLQIGNHPFARYTLFLSEKVLNKGEYFCIDYTRFYPEPVQEKADEEEPLSAQDILNYNRTYQLILEKKYVEALKYMLRLPTNHNNTAAVLEAVESAIERDSKFNVDEFFMALIPGGEVFSFGEPQFINLFLAGGMYMREIAVHGVPLLVEDNEDAPALRELGEIFFVNGEYGAAKILFDKVLSLCLIDEVSLYYRIAIACYEKDNESVEKYKAIFLEAYKCGHPPMDALLSVAGETTDKKEPVTYLGMSDTLRNRINDIYPQNYAETGDMADEEKEAIRSMCIFGEESEVYEFLEGIHVNSDARQKFHSVLLEMLYSPYAQKDVKETILHYLIADGYEGKIYLNTPDKGIICDVMRLHKRMGFMWNELYESLVGSIITGNSSLPLFCGILSSVIKKCYDTLGKIDEETYRGMYDIVLCNYIKKVPFNIDYEKALRAMDVDLEMLRYALQKFKMETPFL